MISIIIFPTDNPFLKVHAIEVVYYLAREKEILLNESLILSFSENVKQFWQDRRQPEDNRPSSIVLEFLYHCERQSKKAEISEMISLFRWNREKKEFYLIQGKPLSYLKETDLYITKSTPPPFANDPVFQKWVESIQKADHNENNVSKDNNDGNNHIQIEETNNMVPPKKRKERESSIISEKDKKILEKAADDSLYNGIRLHKICGYSGTELFEKIKNYIATEYEALNIVSDKERIIFELRQKVIELEKYQSIFQGLKGQIENL